MTQSQTTHDYRQMALEDLEILALDGDEEAENEIYQREIDISYPDCDPEQGICYCCFCFMHNEDEEDEFQPVQVWFTEKPGGHNGWE